VYLLSSCAFNHNILREFLGSQITAARSRGKNRGIRRYALPSGQQLRIELTAAIAHIVEVYGEKAKLKDVSHGQQCGFNKVTIQRLMHNTAHVLMIQIMQTAAFTIKAYRWLYVIYVVTLLYCYCYD
jgi:hypothetical protein